MGDANLGKRLQDLEKGKDKFDLQAESLKNNEFLKNYGRDKYTFKPENYVLKSHYYRTYEA